MVNSTLAPCDDELVVDELELLEELLLDELDELLDELLLEELLDDPLAMSLPCPPQPAKIRAMPAASMLYFLCIVVSHQSVGFIVCD